MLLPYSVDITNFIHPWLIHYLIKFLLDIREVNYRAKVIVKFFYKWIPLWIDLNKYTASV